MTAIVVVLPTVVGEVTAIDGNTITVTQPGGTTATIHVDGDTTYQVNGAAGALSDIKVGSFIVAEGTQRSRRLARRRSHRSGRSRHQGPGLPGRPARAEGSERQPRTVERRQLTVRVVSTPAARSPCGARAAFDSHVVLSARRLMGRNRSTHATSSTIGAPDVQPRPRPPP